MTLRMAPSAVFLLIAAIALGAGAFARQPPPPPTKARVNEAAPAFTLVDSKGQKRSLADYKGKIVVLEWTDQGCPHVDRHCKRGSMRDTYRAVKALDKSIVWLAIDSTYSTDPKVVNFWIDTYKIEYPVLLDPDGAVARTYDARRTPEMFVIDAKGVLRYHGAIDDNRLGTQPPEKVRNYVVNAVKQIVNEETVSPEYEKPYGCSIKTRR